MAVLFEKIYPEPDWDKIADDDDRERDPQAVAFIKYLEKMRRKTIYEPIPERMEESRKLVKMVQDFSEKYEVNAKAEQDESHIMIILSLDSLFFTKEAISDFANILLLVDTVAFLPKAFESDDVGVLMTYHTHKAIPPKETEQQSL